jgi:hypothetical protein
MAFSAQAYRVVHLMIVNPGAVPLSVTLMNDRYNCYEGRPPIGEVMDLPAGGRYEMTLARVQGHGCDGKQGEIALQFSPSPAGRSVQHLDFDNDGGLELQRGWPNEYPGKLVRNPDGGYQYIVWRRPAVTAERSVGYWRLVCQQICNNTQAMSRSVTRTTEHREDKETINAVSMSLEAGIEFEGLGAKSSFTVSQEKRIGQSMSESLQRGETFTDTRNYVFTPEQMLQYHIFAVWQWVARTPLSDGSTFIIGSNKLTCTPDAQRPAYLPGSPQDLRACRGG